MTRDAIATDKLAAPVGPFSLGVRGVGLLFLSGQVAQDPATGRLIDGDVARQTHQILGNIATALETVGKDPARLRLRPSRLTVLPAQRCCVVQAGLVMLAEQGGCHVWCGHGPGAA